MNIFKKELCEGVSLSAVKTDKFKSDFITVSFVLPLSDVTASGYSLLTNLLSLSCAKYPTMQKLRVAKDELYALGLDTYVRRWGELLLVTAETVSLADSYTLSGEANLEKAIEILGEILFAPAFEDGHFISEYVESEKLCLTEEICSVIEDKRSFALKRAREIMCESEPYAADPDGTVEGVEAITPETLTEVYRYCLSSPAVEIVYVGESDGEKVFELMKRHLPFAPRKRDIPEGTVHKVGSLKRVTEPTDGNQSVLVLGFGMPTTVTHGERAVLSVFDEIFAASPMSKLFTGVREKRGLCYYCNSYTSGRKNVMLVACGISPRNAQKAEKAILSELESMKKGEFSDSDVENAKKAIHRSLRAVEGSLTGMNSFALGQALHSEPLTPGEIGALVDDVARDEVIGFANKIELDTVYLLRSEEK